MRVLVFGGNGQVGYCLDQELKSRDITYQVTTRPIVDITDTESVLKAVNSFNPTVLINATAYTNVEKAEDEPEVAMLVNAEAVGNLAKIAEEKKIPLLHISTDYVFDGTKDGLYKEDDKVNPLSVYGKSKLQGEIAIAQNCVQHIILRTSWVFGRHGNNFVKTMLKLFKSKESISVVADQFGGPTFANDIAKALIDIALYIEANPGFSNWGIYNYTGLPAVSWYEFADKIWSVAKDNNYELSLKELNKTDTKSYKTKATRPLNSKLKFEKVRIFNIQASDWQKEISENLKFYQC